MTKANLNDVKAHSHLSDAEREVRKELRKIKHEQSGDVRTASKMARLQGAKQRMEARLEVLKTEIEKCEARTLDFFVRHGIQKITIRKTNLYMSRQLWAGLEKDVTHEEAKAALDAAGLGEFSAPRLNSQTFSAYVREISAVEEGELPLTPEQSVRKLPVALHGIIKCSEVVKINARKG
jgi:hypothetical protein